MTDDGDTPPPPDGSRTQAFRRAETERRLLDAALALIAESGSRSMSTARVGAAAGYSRGIVTHQFGSKQELLRRAVEHAQALVSVSPRASGLDWILELVDKYLAVSADGDIATRAFLLMWGEAVANDDNVRDVYVERDEWFRGLVAAAVAEGVAQGTIRRAVDPAAFAYLLVGQLRGTMLQLMLVPDTAMQTRLRAECAAMVRRHLVDEEVRDHPA
ncbi:MAG: TetR family transcriptional regulator [Mycobacterium sp.]